MQLTPETLAEAFLNVVGQIVSLDQDPVLASSSMYSPKDKVIVLMSGGGTPVLTLSTMFRELAQQREIGAEVLRSLGVPKQVAVRVAERGAMKELAKLLNDVPLSMLRQDVK